MKELLKGSVVSDAVGYEIKIEDGQLKIAATVALDKLVDLGAKAVPGDSAIEQMIVQLIKSALKSV